MTKKSQASLDDQDGRTSVLLVSSRIKIFADDGK